MRHRNKVNSLTRTVPHRKAMLANMATSLLMHKRIKTTVAKAKVLRSYFEPIITMAKEDTMHARRYAFLKLRNKEGVIELFKNVMPVIQRQSGYTRILKIGHRVSDNALMCYVELVDFNTTYQSKEEASKKRRTRRGKTTKKVDDAEVVKEIKVDTTKNIDETTENKD